MGNILKASEKYRTLPLYDFEIDIKVNERGTVSETMILKPKPDALYEDFEIIELDS